MGGEASKPNSDVETHTFKIAKLLYDSKYADVTISTGQKQFQAHKFILASRSPMFDSIFENQMNEKENNIIRISDISERTVEKLLCFIYTNEVDDIDSIAMELLYAADKYEVGELKIICTENIKKNLTVTNAAENLIMADCHMLSDIKDHILRFIITHREDIIKTEGFRILEKAHMHLVVEVFKAKPLDK